MIELVALDVDGVLRDSSRLVYECYKTGLGEIGLGKKFAEAFTVKDLWHFKGLGNQNSKRESLKSLSVLLSMENIPKIPELIADPDAENIIARTSSR